MGVVKNGGVKCYFASINSVFTPCEEYMEHDDRLRGPPTPHGQS